MPLPTFPASGRGSKQVLKTLRKKERCNEQRGESGARGRR